MTKRWEYAEAIGIEAINAMGALGWRAVSGPIWDHGGNGEWRLWASMEREVPKRDPELVRLDAFLSAAASKAMHGGDVPMELDTPERAAEILRENGYPQAHVHNGNVWWDGLVMAIAHDMRCGLNWPDSARYCLRRWPVTP